MKQTSHDERGREIPDQTPVELPAGCKVPESLDSMIARMVRGHVSELAAKEGMETFEEANDFELEEEDEYTESEEREMKLEALKDDQMRLKELEDKFADEAKAAAVREKVEKQKRRRAIAAAKKKAALEEPPETEDSED